MVSRYWVIIGDNPATFLTLLSFYLLSHVVKALGLLQRHIHDLSDQACVSREMDHRVVAKDVRSHSPVLVVIQLLHQNLLYRMPLMSALRPRRQMSWTSFKQPVKTVLHHVLRDLVFHRRCRCSGTFGVDESKGTVVAHPSHHIHGLLEVLLSLSREAHDDIRGQGRYPAWPRGASPPAPGTAPWYISGSSALRSGCCPTAAGRCRC